MEWLPKPFTKYELLPKLLSECFFYHRSQFFLWGAGWDMVMASALAFGA